jgi:hypothetical protein
LGDFSLEHKKMYFYTLFGGVVVFNVIKPVASFWLLCNNVLLIILVWFFLLLAGQDGIWLAQEVGTRTDEWRTWHSLPSAL